MDETVSNRKCILNAKAPAYQWTFGGQSMAELGAAAVMKPALNFQVIHFFRGIWSICSKFQPAGCISNCNEIYTTSPVTNQKATWIWESMKQWEHTHQTPGLYLSQAICSPIFNQRLLLIIWRQVVSHCILRDFNSVLSSKLIYLHEAGRQHDCFYVGNAFASC